jgi:DNA-directed RNA polymerase specialized sigma24 family protein
MIRALTDAQWARLRKASGYFSWISNLGADDLLQEAFCRALADGRHCPTNVDIVRFLVQAMRSIANGEGDKPENKNEPVPLVQPGTPVIGAVDLEDSADSQEETMIAVEKAEATRQAFLGLFPDDSQARDLVDGILAGYEGAELRALTDLTETNYASKRRFMRRTIDKHYPEGKKP